jgi:hypothetical protein
MSRIHRRWLWAVAASLLVAAPVVSQVQVRPARRPEMVRPPGDSAPAFPPASSALTTVRPEPVAETRLIMEGMSQPNFQGIQRNLRQEPGSEEAWTFLRGQALLVAESSNLLLMRPPRNEGQAAWQELAAAQRTAATKLARAAASRDYVKSRVALADLTNACNRCHRTFRVATQLDPLPAEK